MIRPSAHTKKIIARDHKVSSRALTRAYPYVFKEGKGVHVKDIDGNTYLDCCAGIAVMSTGYNNPEVLKAIRDQIPKGLHVAYGDFYAEKPIEFKEEILKHAKGYEKVFLSNSGTEAVECAYKAARWHTNKNYTVAFDHAFHGRTMGSLSLTHSKHVHRDRFGPFLLVRHTPYAYCYRSFQSEEDCVKDTLDRLEKTLRRQHTDTAAVIMEPIQGEGGYIVPPKSFVQGVRKLTTEHNALLISDEVQAGCYRTGKFHAIENFNVKPDLVSMGKALGGGLPVGATLARKGIMNWPQGAHGNTFGGNLLAAASGIATLKYMQKKKLGEHAKRMGVHLMKQLNELKDKYEIIGDVRGIGLMVGVEFVETKHTRKELAPEKLNKILTGCYQRGLIVLSCGVNTIRFSPPLTITKKDIDKAVSILEASIRGLPA